MADINAKHVSCVSNLQLFTELFSSFYLKNYSVDSATRVIFSIKSVLSELKMKNNCGKFLIVMFVLHIEYSYCIYDIYYDTNSSYFST